MTSVCAQVTQRCVTREKSIKAGDKRQKSIKTRSSRTTHCHSIRVYLRFNSIKKQNQLEHPQCSFHIVFLLSSFIRFVMIFLQRVYLHRGFLHKTKQSHCLLLYHTVYRKIGKKIVLTGTALNCRLLTISPQR